MNKTLNILLGLFCILTIVSCSKETLTDEGAVVDTVAAIEPVILPVEQPKFDYYQHYKDKIIQTLYVTNRNGVEIKEQADSSSQSFGSYSYGDKLKVIEIADQWLGVLDNKGGKGWGKFYVLNNSAGDISQIQLDSSDLNIITSMTLNQKTEYFEKGKNLNDYIKIELTDQQTFEDSRENSVTFLIADTAIVKKENGIIDLKCKLKNKKYIDKPDLEEQREEFKYVGQIDFLNRYIVSGSYWEAHDYRFIDKTGGEETDTLGAYPNISPDKRHIICIWANPYDMTGDLELYSIHRNKIKHIVSVGFKNWMPTAENGEIFWSTDGYLYLTANHVASFWKENGHNNEKCQYLKIKIL
jgi:hypothetical protein